MKMADFTIEVCGNCGRDYKVYEDYAFGVCPESAELPEERKE